MSVRQPVRVRLGHLVAEHRADGAVDVAHGDLSGDRRAVADARRAAMVMSWWSRAFSRPWSCVVVLRRGEPSRALHVGEDRAEVEPGRLPVVDRPWSASRPTPGRSPPRWSGSRAPRGARAPPRRCTRRTSRRTRACRRTARAARGSGSRCRRDRCRGGRRAS